MVEGSEAGRAALMTARKSTTTPETRQSTLEGQVRPRSPAGPGRGEKNWQARDATPMLGP